MAGRTLAPPWPSGRRRGPGAATSASIVHQTKASIKGARRKALQDGRHCLSNPGIPVGRRLDGGHATLGGAVPAELATAVIDEVDALGALGVFRHLQLITTHPAGP